MRALRVVLSVASAVFGMRSSTSVMVARFEVTVLKRAGLRWARLKVAHADGNYLDGCAMFNALRGVLSSLGLTPRFPSLRRLVYA